MRLGRPLSKSLLVLACLTLALSFVAPQSELEASATSTDQCTTQVFDNAHNDQPSNDPAHGATPVLLQGELISKPAETGKEDNVSERVSEEPQTHTPAGSQDAAALQDGPPGLAPADEEEDRHNFALAKDGAKVIAANKEAKKAGALLDSDGDTYLKNECKADKWIIVELSQLVRMDTLILAQNELYSSRIKEFEVRGRQTHPRLEGTDYNRTLNSSSWHVLGRFNASNTKGNQAFKLKSPVWTKYLQLRMLSHHGTEAVCALNDLCVYGKSAAEDLEDRLSSDPDLAEDPTLVEPPIEPTALPDKPESGDKLADKAPEKSSPPKEVVPGTEVTIDVIQDAKVVDSQPAENNKAGTEEVSAHSAPAPGREFDRAGPSNQNQDQPPAVSLTETDGLDPTAPQGWGQLNVSPPKSDPPEQPQSNDTANEAEHPAAAVQIPEGSTEAPSTLTEISLEKATVEPAKIDLELPINSPGSSATRHGGSMYDKLVQELRNAKLTQRNITRTLDGLRRNVTAILGRFALDLDLITMRLNVLQPPIPAIMPSEEDMGVCGTATAASGTCPVSNNNFSQKGPQVVSAPTDLEILQGELADLRQLIMSQNLRIQKLVIVPLFLLCGCLGLLLLYLVCWLPPSRTSFLLMMTGCFIIGWLLRTYSDDLLSRDT